MTTHDTSLPHATVSPVDIAFTAGGRRLMGVQRSLVTVAPGLPDLVLGRQPAVPVLPPWADGYRLLSLPELHLTETLAALPGFVAGPVDRFARHYIDMADGFDAYLARFSAKTRQTMRRKAKKFAKLDRGSPVDRGLPDGDVLDVHDDALDVREYRTPPEITAFMALTAPLSQRTYQDRLLDAGLPTGPDALAEAQKLARQDRVRAFLLFSGGVPVSYLYLPIAGEGDNQSLIYSYLGYDPGYARHSPGTILQMAALESLFAEQRFRWFDFTEGEGAHKTLFGTHSLDCASLVLLRPDLANKALLRSRSMFDGAVARASGLAEAAGVKTQLGRILKR